VLIFRSRTDHGKEFALGQVKADRTERVNLFAERAAVVHARHVAQRHVLRHSMSPTKVAFPHEQPDSSELIHREDWQDQLRGMCGVVINGVSADLVGPVEMPEQAIRDWRIPTTHFEADAVALAEAVRDRL
jgi:hypothetical protein